MRRIVLCLVLLLGTLLIPATAFAQDECTGAIDPESEFLTFSKEAMAALSSYATSSGLRVDIVNAPGLPAELSTTMDIDGQFAINPELTARFMELQEMDPADMQGNLAEIMDMVVELYQTMAFNMDMNIGFSTDLANMIAASSDLPSFPSSISLPTRMVDGFMYFNVDSVASQFNAPEEVQGWIGIDYGTLMADSVDEMMSAMEDGGSEVDAAMASSMASVGSIFALQQAAQEYVSIEGEGIETLDGVDVCVLSSSYDLAGFLADPAFISMMVEQMKTQMAMQEEMGAEGEMPMTEGDVEMVAQMLPMLAPMLLSGLTLENVQSIGVDDGLVRSTETVMEWDMASLANMLGAMMAQSGEESPLDPNNPPHFLLSVVSENSAFDEEFEVEVPDPVQIIPLEALQESE